MKLKFMFQKLMRHSKIVQWFGEGRLVRHPNGRYELIGGTRADFTAAKEWISLFGHEIILPPPTNLRRPPLTIRNQCV
jgi:hypothetical protein